MYELHRLHTALGSASPKPWVNEEKPRFSRAFPDLTSDLHPVLKGGTGSRARKTSEQSRAGPCSGENCALHPSTVCGRARVAGGHSTLCHVGWAARQILMAAAGDGKKRCEQERLRINKTLGVCTASSVPAVAMYYECVLIKLQSAMLGTPECRKQMRISNVTTVSVMGGTVRWYIRATADILTHHVPS